MVQARRLEMGRADQRELRKWLRSGKTRRSLAERAKIILLSQKGLSAAAIGDKLGVARLTVYKWRRRFQEGGLEALSDRPRPGQPRKLTVDKTEEILRLATQRIPKESTHWSLRLMAHASSPATSRL